VRTREVETVQTRYRTPLSQDAVGEFEDFEEKEFPMKNKRHIHRNAMAVLALAAIVTLQSLQLATSARSLPGSRAVEANLGTESRTLDTYLDDLARLDKKGLELGNKPALSRAEFDAHQRTADDLKRRLSAVQTALRDAITKLKAAGQWDNLDQIVLAKISNSKFQELVRRDGFKRSLETAASTLSNNANEIDSPLSNLRNKVQARDLGFEPGQSALALRAVPVAYTPSPAAFASKLRCSLAYLRAGISGAFNPGTGPSTKANLGILCFCDGNFCNEYVAQ
jgi:hypothetical protein